MGEAKSTRRGHAHGEAYNLMTYACDCGHQEVIWNSRDGVTPFGLGCPSCGNTSLRHVDWRRDVYAPDHRLHRGQRFFRDGTPDEAEAIMRRRIEVNRDKYPIDEEYAARLIKEARDGASSEFQKGWPKLAREGDEAA